MGLGSGFGGSGCGQWVSWLIWFVVAVVIAYIVLHLIGPTWVKKQNADGSLSAENDPGKLFLWAVILALVCCFVIWMLKSCLGGGMGRY